MTDDKLKSDIENELSGIYDKWLKLHFMTAIATVIASTLIEIALGVLFGKMGLVYSGTDVYIRKYILAPLSANIVLSVLSYLTLRSHTNRKTKKYLISLLFVLICFVIFTAHNVFDALFVIFIIPVLMTVIYGSYMLTTVTALSGFILRVFSEEVIIWNPYRVCSWSDSMLKANMIISILLTLTVYAACMIIIFFEKKKNEAGIQSEIDKHNLRRRLKTDELTEVGSRYALEKALEEMQTADIDRCMVVMMDLDNFKLINDGFGHDKGDDFLKDFGRLLKNNCGDAQPYRYGGDEFILLFELSNTDAAVAVSRVIREETRKLASEHYPGLPLGVSFGIAVYMKGMTVSNLVRKADSALYRAKKTKEGICVLGEEE
jgi:diguanylate cyclase